MTLLSFVRCRHCGLPHEAERRRCPFTNLPIEMVSVLPEAPNEEVVGPSLVGGLVEGKYEVDSLIGEGSMGSVFAARNVLTSRKVALKILHGSLRDDERATQRFLRESRAAARIDHPNVVRIYDAGTSDEGLPFIVMELIEGEPLSDRILAEGALPIPEVMHIGAELLDGLAAAHAVGVIHRDVKPENVVLTPAGDAKILDFSIAKLLGSLTTFTGTGEVIGTPAFLAPEQAMGEPVDQLTDAWAAAVVLYEMATGVLPFQGQHLGEVVGQILHEEPAPPRELRPGIPPGLEQVILAGLTKNKERRPNVSELRAALSLASS